MSTPQHGSAFKKTSNFFKALMSGLDPFDSISKKKERLDKIRHILFIMVAIGVTVYFIISDVTNPQVSSSTDKENPFHLPAVSICPEYPDTELSLALLVNDPNGQDSIYYDASPAQSSGGGGASSDSTNGNGTVNGTDSSYDYSGSGDIPPPANRTKLDWFQMDDEGCINIKNSDPWVIKDLRDKWYLILLYKAYWNKDDDTKKYKAPRMSDVQYWISMDYDNENATTDPMNYIVVPASSRFYVYVQKSYEIDSHSKKTTYLQSNMFAAYDDSLFEASNCTSSTGARLPCTKSELVVYFSANSLDVTTITHETNYALAKRIFVDITSLMGTIGGIMVTIFGTYITRLLFRKTRSGIIDADIRDSCLFLVDEYMKKHAVPHTACSEECCKSSTIQMSVEVTDRQ